MRGIVRLCVDPPLVPVALLVVLAFLLYANSFDNSFHYDDKHSIRDNPHLRQTANIPAFFSDPGLFSRDPDKGMYRPLLLTSFALNYAWDGYRTRTYRLVNILLHGFCAALVWGVARRLGQPAPRALLAGLLFVAHPLASEPVNYISSRSELLAAFFVLAACWFYLGKGKWSGAAAILCFAAGLLSKSSAIALLALLPCLEWIRGGLDRWAWPRYAPYGVVALVYLVQIRHLLDRAVWQQPVRPFDQQIATQIKACWYYIQLLVAPVRQSVDHAFFSSDPGQIPVVISLLGVGVLVGLAFWGRRRHPFVFLGVLWIGVTLAPASLVPLNVLVNEHRLYLPLAGWALALSGLNLLERGPGLLWLAPLCMAVLGLLTVQRNTVWASEATLWADAAAKAPEAVRPQVYLGNAALDRADALGAANPVGAQQALDRARRHFERALVLEPDNLAARNNLAGVALRRGDWTRASQIYRQILADNELSDVRYNLAHALQQGGDQEQAQQNYLRVDPASYHYPLALNNLGSLHEGKGRPDSAWFYYRRALQHRPQARDPRQNLERLARDLPRLAEDMLNGGQATVVEAWCRQVLEDRPKQRQAWFFLAVSLFVQGRYSDSIATNQKLTQHFPRFYEGHLQLANALESSGRLREARTVYQTMAGLTPPLGLEGLAAARLSALEGKLKR